MITPFIMSNLISPETTGELTGSGRTTGGGAGTGSPFAQLIKKAAANAGLTGLSASQTSPVSLKGQALVAQLKQALLASGAHLDQLVADDKALAAMEKMLVCAGFDSGQVKSLLDGLKAEARGQGVRLSTLFEGISQLKEPAIKKSEPAHLDISAVPFLETVLPQFGLSQEEAASLLDKVKVEGKGVDVQKLADELKLMGSAGKKPSGDPQALARMNDLLQKIGLGTDANGNKVVDLSGLVSALENFADQKGSNGQTQDVSASAGPNGAGGTSDSAGRAASIAMKEFQKLVLEKNAASAQNAENGQGQGGSIASGAGRMSLNHFSGALETETKRQGGLLRTPVSENWRDTMTNGTSGKTEGNVSAAKINAASAVSSDQRAEAVKAGIPQPEVQSMLNQGQTEGDRKQGQVRAGATAGKSDDATGSLFAGGSVRSTNSTHTAATQAAAQPSAPRTLPYYVLNQVSRQILKSRLLNESEIQLQLKPPSMGRLKLSIEHTTNGIKVNIIAESHAARDLLLSHAGDLKSALSDQGIRLNRLDVGTQGGAFGQSMADAHQGSERFFNRSGFAHTNRGQFESLPAQEAIEPVTTHESNALNLVA
jgi:flagellar hook-length control protein FliK